jgi:hypothetical protein
MLGEVASPIEVTLTRSIQLSSSPTPASLYLDQAIKLFHFGTSGLTSVSRPSTVTTTQ